MDPTGQDLYVDLGADQQKWAAFQSSLARRAEAEVLMLPLQSYFDGVKTLEIHAQAYQDVALDDIPQDTTLTSRFLVGLSPTFRIREDTKGDNGYRLTKITTLTHQYVKKGEEASTRTSGLVCPVVHEGLPGLEPVFLWPSYGMSLEKELLDMPKITRTQGGAVTFAEGRENNIVSRALGVPDRVQGFELGSTVGKFGVAISGEAVGSADGIFLVNCVVYWKRLFEHFREEHVMEWERLPETRVMFPKTFSRFILNEEDDGFTKVASVKYTTVIANVSIDTNLFSIPGLS